MTESERIALADVVHVAEGCELHLLQELELPALLKVVLELEVAVEVIFDRARPVMIRMSVSPACTASSTTY